MGEKIALYRVLFFNINLNKLRSMPTNKTRIFETPQDESKSWSHLKLIYWLPIYLLNMFIVRIFEPWLGPLDL